MSETIHVVFDGKVLRPEGKVDLKQNAHYLVTVEREEEKKTHASWTALEDLIGVIEGPEDLSEEHDHYLYGLSKHNKG